MLIGRIQLTQELLGQTPTAQAELAALSQAELTALLAQLTSQLQGKGA